MNFKIFPSKFTDFITQVTREADKFPRLDGKTKALIRLAADVANQDHRGSGSLFNAHLSMALKQGVTQAEIEELLTFLCVYTGFNKVAGCFGSLNEFFEKRQFKPMTSILESRSANYSQRDAKGKVAFYVLLWKRHGISLEMFDNYWKDVHGPVCARLPGQHQYWQYHVAHNHNFQGEASFDGIAELTFESEADRQTWFQAAGILMDDEHNVFRKAIGYNTSPGNSITYVDALPTGAPNSQTEIVKYHVMVQQNQKVSVEAFRQFMKETFAPEIASHPSVLKLRLHLFEEVDNSRPDAAGVIHTEPPENQYQAAYEIAFANQLEVNKFLASEQKARAFQEIDRYTRWLNPFRERSAYTFVYDSEMTLAGQRSAKSAQLITDLGAINQVQDDVVSLMTHHRTSSNGKAPASAQYTKPGQSGLGHLLQGVQHIGVTVKDMEKSLEFYTEVLGGKLVVGESELVGDVIQNTLFQKEELDAIAQGIDPKYLDFPNLRDGRNQALDVKFISFGNTVVELLLVREAGNPNGESAVSSFPSHIGHVNAMHLSFNVKEGIDLNVFAKLLEEECQKRGLDNVVCNRVIDVQSEAERQAVALQHNSFKFWNEPGLPEVDWSHDPMEGWSLFYCKGPNGEQLEFNQVTRKVKQRFREAMAEYNQENETKFDFPDYRI